VPTYYAAIRLEQRNPYANPKRRRPFEPKIGTPVTLVLGNVPTNFGFRTPFCVFELGARTGQADGRMDGQDP